MFKILSIDGGGIRGIIPAKILSLIEEKLNQEGKENQICDYFDLICGTSTGGIIAIGLALGMRTSDILSLYKDKAEKIFPKKYGKFWRLLLNRPYYDHTALKKELTAAYGEVDDEAVRMGHCRTRLCIPVYDVNEGCMHVFKTPHHKDYSRDYQIPAVDVALATSAAPFYFDSYDFDYKRSDNGKECGYKSLVDGGIFANNPCVIGYVEAVRALRVPAEELAILSLGTGDCMYKDTPQRMGGRYWVKNKKGFVPIYDLLSSSQAAYTDNIMKFLQKGCGNDGKEIFPYFRIQHKFDSKCVVNMDASGSDSLRTLENIGNQLYNVGGLGEKLKLFFSDYKNDYVPSRTL